MDDELATAARTLAMAARVLERALDDMTLAQFRVLSLITSSPERASRIAERAAVSKPSLSGLLDGLEARCWVQRVDVAGDRRGVQLELTRAGRTAYNNAQKAVTAQLDSVLAELDGPDRAAVRHGLARLGDALRARALARMQDASTP